MQTRAKPEWDEEKLKVEAARQSREFFDIPLDDEHVKGIVRNARKKLEFCMEPAMLCTPIGEKCTAEAHSGYFVMSVAESKYRNMCTQITWQTKASIIGIITI